MDWQALMILTLLIAAVVGFLAVLVLALQYYTVTKELKELKEDQEADQIARLIEDKMQKLNHESDLRKAAGERSRMSISDFERAMFKLRMQDISRLVVSNEQINDARETLISQDKNK